MMIMFMMIVVWWACPPDSVVVAKVDSTACSDAMISYDHVEDRGVVNASTPFVADDDVDQAQWKESEITPNNRNKKVNMVQHRLQGNCPHGGLLPWTNEPGISRLTQRFVENTALFLHHPRLADCTTRATPSIAATSTTNTSERNTTVQCAPTAAMTTTTTPAKMETPEDDSKGLHRSIDLAEPTCRGKTTNASSVQSKNVCLWKIHQDITTAIVTWWYMKVPPLLAFVNLLIRLLAGYMAVLGILYLSVALVLTGSQQQQRQQSPSTVTRWISIGTLFAALVVLADSQYVLEYGTAICVGMFVASIVLAMTLLQLFSWMNTASTQQRQQQWIDRWLVLLVLTLAWSLTWNGPSDMFHFHLGHRFDVDPNVVMRPGLYYDHNNPNIRAIVRQWTQYNSYPYSWGWLSSRNGIFPTPWMWTGDARTGLPFLMNRPTNPPNWKRLYMTVEDGEVVAIDLAFPANGSIQCEHPIYFVLHGANGGSNESYIQDLAHRRTAAGSTVAVLISRNQKGLPVQDGHHLYHAVRLSDVHAAATVLRLAFQQTCSESSIDDHSKPSTIKHKDDAAASAERQHERLWVVGMGYSMGAIVLTNYVTTYGQQVALDAAFAISGALDCRWQQFNERSQRLWQPMIADHIRGDQFIQDVDQVNSFYGGWSIPQLQPFVRDVLSHEQGTRLLRATNVTALDECVVIQAYPNQFRSVHDFYTQMGALGDVPWKLTRSEDELSIHEEIYALPMFEIDPSDSQDRAELERVRQQTLAAKLSGISIPLGMLHSIDDPISSWRSLVIFGTIKNNGLLGMLDDVSLGHLVVLMTKQGGHVGWPLGWWPPKHGWEFMNEAAAHFFQAIQVVAAE